MKQYLIGGVIGVVAAIALFFGASAMWQRNDPVKVGDTSQNNQQTGVVLDLSNQGITTVTSSVYDKTNTTDLLLSNNSIKSLPSEMGRMNKLVVFKIDHNLLEGSLIGEIRQMSQLKQLDASYNKMTGVPAEIGQLSNLEVLNLSYNQITAFPNEITNIKNNLKSLNVTGNKLSSDQISKLKTQLPNTNVIF
jgi:Leucine-rich repeat (LRR) protein